MSCPKWETDVAMYAGGDLPGSRLTRTLAHLETCAACRELADDLRAGRTLLSEIEDEALEYAMAANIRRRVMARLSVEGAGRRGWYWAWTVAAGLVLAAILVLPRPAKIQVPLARKVAAPAPVAVAATPVLPVVRHAAVRRHHRAPARHAAAQSGEPVLVQLLTNDPNIVIYWLVDPKPQGD